jgi:class 3 adenylate cyclase/tetratricopeptide (TPR) repeat protein
MSCPSCGHPVPDDARFCPHCGHLLVETEERRVVTVVFADLVGFTGLAESRDPEQVKYLVDRCFQRLVSDITAFGGTVDKIVGDGIVALFGAPQAHEDDPERAVRAALRMQRTICGLRDELRADIQMRIGINTGEVLVGALRAGGDYTAMGDTVNAASRLEGIAAPGEVVVAAGTMEATRTVIEYESRGAVIVRGRSEPLDVYVAVSELAPPGRRPRTVKAPLVGRNIELLQLTSAVDTAVARARTHLLLILGEGGMGKSRLAEEVAASAEATHDALVLEGRLVPYGETNPLRPFADAIADVTQVLPGDATEVVAAKLRALLAGPANDGDDLPEAPRVVNALLHLLGRESPVSDYEPQSAFDEVGWALRQVLAHGSQRRPVVVVLSDINWADPLLLQFLETMLGSLVHHPIVIVATARWTDDERWVVPPGRHNTLIMNLDPLDRPAGARLVRTLLGQNVTDEVVDLLLDRSGGNPFFLEELSVLVSEAGVQRTVGDFAELPGTLRGLVSVRLDGLTPSERAMVEDASVVGRAGPVYALLLMARERGELTGEQTFQRLVGKDILVTEGDQWHFRSDLLRDVAYSTLTKASRAKRHTEIASWLVDHYDETGPGYLTSGMIAAHYRAAAELVHDGGAEPHDVADLDEKAVTWLMQAGSEADRRAAHVSAEHYFAEAVDLLRGDDPRLIDVHLGLAKARLGLGQLTRAAEDGREALRRATEAGRDTSRAESLTVLGEIVSVLGDGPQSMELLDEAIELWRRTGESLGLARALRRRGMAAMTYGDFEQAEEDFVAARELFTVLEIPAGVAWCLQNLARLAFEQGDVDTAERRIDEAFVLFDTAVDAGGLAWVSALLTYVRYHQGRFDEAAELAEQVLADAKKRGDRFPQALVVMLLGSISLWTGRVEEGIDHMERSLELFETMDSSFGIVQTLAILARAYTLAGRFGEADAALSRARVVAGSAPGQSQLDLVRMVDAASAMQRGDTDRALACLEECGSSALKPTLVGSIDQFVTRAYALMQQGRAVAALELLEEARRLQTSSSPGTYLASALAMALVMNGRLDEAEREVDGVLQAPGATWLDRSTAVVARVMVRVRRRAAEGLEEVLAEAMRIVDDVDSPTAQAFVRLARAVAYEAVDHDDASLARADATLSYSALGLDSHSWDTVLRTMAYGEVAVPSEG